MRLAELEGWPFILLFETDSEADHPALDAVGFETMDQAMAAANDKRQYCLIVMKAWD